MNRKDPSTDLTNTRCTLRPEQRELVSAAFNSGTPDGFSVEWALDRFNADQPQNGRAL